MMCFYNDYDWYAQVSDSSSGPADTKARCDECGKVINPGDWRYHLDQQEEECCRTCDEGGDNYDDDDPQDPLTCEHDFGETFDYDRCDKCDKILKAIEAVEIKEGCPPDARRPRLMELRETFIEHSSAPVYAATAIEMYSEVGDVEWLLRALVGDEE